MENSLLWLLGELLKTTTVYSNPVVLILTELEEKFDIEKEEALTMCKDSLFMVDEKDLKDCLIKQPVIASAIVRCRNKDIDALIMKLAKEVIDMY